MIDLDVNVVHASSSVAGDTRAVSWGEDVECGVGLWAVGILCSAVDWHERVVPVFLVAIASLDAIDLYEGRYNLSFRISDCAGLSG